MVINKERLMQNTKEQERNLTWLHSAIPDNDSDLWASSLRCRLAFYFPVYQFLITKYPFLITKWRFQALLVVSTSLCTAPWHSIHPFPRRTDTVPSETRSELQHTPAGCQVHPPLGTLQRCFQSLCQVPSCLWFSIKVKQHRNSYPGFQNCDIHPKTLQLASCCQPRHTRTNDDHLPSLLG